MSERPMSVWRPRTSSLAGVTLVAAGIAAFAVDVYVSNDESGDRPFAVAMLAVPLVLMAAVLRFRLTLYGDRIVVRGWLGADVVRLGDLAEVETGRSGLVLHRSDGSRVLAEAVQQSPLASRLGARTRADRVAQELLRARDAHSE